MTSISPFSPSAIPPLSPARNPAGGAGLNGTTTDRAGLAGAAGDPSAGEAANDFAGAVGSAVSDALTQVGQLEEAVTEASRQAAVGSLDSISDFMIATAEAQLATEVTVAVRDRAVTAFNDIMRMQI